jgi:hypothetical protein
VRPCDVRVWSASSAAPAGGLAHRWIRPLIFAHVLCLRARHATRRTDARSDATRGPGALDDAAAHRTRSTHNRMRHALAVPDSEETPMPALIQLGRSIDPTSALRRARRMTWLARDAASSKRGARRGAVLVEVALIAIAFYMLMAGLIEVGRMIFTSQLLQNAARVAARELAMLPLPATMTFDQALDHPDVRAAIYNDRFLFVELQDNAVDSTVDQWPIVNRMLYPLMIREPSAPGMTRLRYPGAVVEVGGQKLVFIPQIVSQSTDGTATIRWHRVIEEIVPTVTGNPNPPGPFSMTSTIAATELRGLVALRINYPFEAATLSAYHHPVDAGPDDPNRNQVVLANDGGVSPDPNHPLPGDPITISGDGVYSGKWGLGTLHALGQDVRPFSSLLTAQSIFRREVFN